MKQEADMDLLVEVPPALVLKQGPCTAPVPPHGHWLRAVLGTWGVMGAALKIFMEKVKKCWSMEMNYGLSYLRSQTDFVLQNNIRKQVGSEFC